MPHKLEDDMGEMDKVYSKTKDIVSREIDNEMILMPIYKNNTDINEMYTLNETAASMWGLIDGKRTLSDIADEMTKSYEVSKDEIEKDLLEFIKDMKDIKAVSA